MTWCQVQSGEAPSRCCESVGMGLSTSTLREHGGFPVIHWVYTGNIEGLYRDRIGVIRLWSFCAHLISGDEWDSHSHSCLS